MTNLNDEEMEIETEEQELDEQDNSEDQNESENAEEQENEDKDQKRWQNKVQKRFNQLTARIYERDAIIEDLQNKLSSFSGSQNSNQTNLQDPPKKENYATDEEWIEAVADYKAEQKVKAYEAKTLKDSEKKSEKEKQQDLQKKFTSNIKKTAEKYKDYHDVTSDITIPVNSDLGRVILESDQSGELMYYIGKNPDIEEKLSELSGMKLAIEIGKIEERLSKPLKKKGSKAPDPITTETKRGSASPSGQPDFDKMNADDYYRARYGNKK